MRFLLPALFLALAAPAHGASAPSYFAPARNAEYLSFAELYRMTLSGVSVVEFAAGPQSAQAQLAVQLPEYQVRVAAAEPQPASAAFAVAAAPESTPARYTFSTPALPEPSSRWLLLLSGLAVAAWVARRRLGYSF